MGEYEAPGLASEAQRLSGGGRSEAQRGAPGPWLEVKWILLYCPLALCHQGQRVFPWCHLPAERLRRRDECAS